MLATLGSVYEERWSRTDHLLAHIFDAVQGLIYVAQRAPHYGEKTLKELGKQKPPEPFPRPGQHQNRRRRGTTIGEFAQMLGRGDDG